MTKDPAVYLRHLLQCIERVRDYTRDGRDAFSADTRTQDAVLRNLEIIGQVERDLPAMLDAVRRMVGDQPGA